MVVLALVALALLGSLWLASEAPLDPLPAIAPLSTPPAAPELAAGPAPPHSAPRPRASLVAELLGDARQAAMVQLMVVVAGPDGRALGGANVLLAGRRAGFSDARGRFEARFPRAIEGERELELAVHAPGCVPWQRRVRVTAGTAHARAQLTAR